MQSEVPNSRRRGDAISIPGDYQARAACSRNPVQRFWHATKKIVIDELLPVLPGDVAVDAGCGSGVVTDSIAAAGADATGIDANPEAIAFATRTFDRPNLRFIQALVDDEIVLDRPVDKVYSMEVIEHLPPSQALEMLRGFHRMLRPGGRILITTPNYRSYWPLLEWTLDAFALAPRMAVDQHVEHYHPRKLRDTARQAGFDVTTVRTICLVSPWLAPLNWRLASSAAKRELASPILLGCLLAAVLTKAAD